MVITVIPALLDALALQTLLAVGLALLVWWALVLGVWALLARRWLTEG